MNAVFQIDPSAVTATERLVLLNLANHGNDRGRNAFPSVSRIARQTSLGRRAVQKALRRLQQKGLIVAVGNAKRGVGRYALALKTIRTCEHGSPQPANHVRRPANHVRPTCEPRSPSPANHVRTTCEPRSPDPLPNRELNRDLTVRNAASVAVTARSKRPIFTGQRLKVFEWMLDDLQRLLGPFTEGFDLHEWFFTLDARAVSSGCVIPQRDSGAWLQAQTLEEAVRRGLPVAVPPPPPTAMMTKANARHAEMHARIVRSGE